MVRGQQDIAVVDVARGNFAPARVAMEHFGPRAAAGTMILPMAVSVGVIAAWIQLGERPSLAEGSGMLLILSGLALLTGTQRNAAVDQP